MLNSQVSSGTSPLVLLVEDSNARVALGKLVKNGGGVVGGAVVYKDRFKGAAT